MLFFAGRAQAREFGEGEERGALRVPPRGDAGECAQVDGRALEGLRPGEAREARAAERRGPEESAVERVEGVVPRVAARAAPGARLLVDRLEQSGVGSRDSGVKAWRLVFDP